MKNKIVKEIKGMLLPLTIIGILYLTGLHIEVLAFAQRMMLATHIVTPDIDNKEKSFETFDYNFKVKQVDGDIIDFNEYKGKVLFINIWATWCAPCVAEMPSIDKLYKDIDDDKIIFIMLSTENDVNKIEQHLTNKGYSFPGFVAASSMPELLRVPSIPTTFVIDKEGKIQAKKVGMANYNTKRFKKFLTSLAAQ